MEQNRVFELLKKLDISYKTKISYKGWIPVLCPSPSHPDSHFGNAAINIQTGVVNCFSCGYARHLIGIAQDKFNMTYKEAEDFINEKKSLDSIDKLNEKTETTIKNDKPEIECYLTIDDFPFTTLSLDSNKYKYTRNRHWHLASNKWEVYLCTSGKYTDYAIIPIHDNNLNIHSFEARKIMEFEYLLKFFEIDDYDKEREKKIHRSLKEKFKQLCEKYEAEYDSGKVYLKGVEINDPNLLYLMRPKTLYPFNSNIFKTLYNIDKLDKTKPLHTCEGLATYPILSSVYENCTCLFGANVDEEQIKYLKMFPEIIHIPDNDRAGVATVEHLRPYLKNFKIIKTPHEDTDGDIFINDIKTFQPIEASRFLIQTYRILEAFL